MRDEKLYAELKEASFPEKRKETEAFVDELILDLWKEGWSLLDIRETGRSILLEKQREYRNRNTSDILQEKYADLSELKKNMPMYEVSEGHYVHVPRDVMQWVIFLEHFYVHNKEKKRCSGYNGKEEAHR